MSDKKIRWSGNMSENSISAAKMWLTRDLLEEKNLLDIALYVTVCSRNVIFF